MVFFTTAAERFNWLAGNLDVLGGLGPGSETVGQDKLLAANSSKMMSDMEQAVIEGVRDVMRDLAWWRFYDPMQQEYVVKSMEGLPELQVTSELPPWGQRESNNFRDFDFKIEPYSMQYQSPNQKVATLMGLVDRLMPAMPMLQQQGRTLDADALVRIIARYTGMHELEEVITYTEPPPDMAAGGMGGSHERTMPGNTTRTVQRVNVPGRSQQGANYALMQTMLGGGVQNPEAAAAVRIGNR
jgi:hypothetical protein